jgi:hypothetical protein
LLIKPEDAPEIIQEIEFFEGIQMPDQVEYDLFWKCVRIYLEVFETRDLFQHNILNLEAEQLLEE